MALRTAISVHHFGTDENISTSIGWIAMNCDSDIYVSLRIICNNVGDVTMWSVGRTQTQDTEASRLQTKGIYYIQAYWQVGRQNRQDQEHGKDAGTESERQEAGEPSLGLIPGNLGLGLIPGNLGLGLIPGNLGLGLIPGNLEGGEAEEEPSGGRPGGRAETELGTSGGRPGE